MDEEEYYTPEELAQKFKVTRQAVHQWIRTGKLYAIRLGTSVRIPKSALRAFLRPAVDTEEHPSRPDANL